MCGASIGVVAVLSLAPLGLDWLRSAPWIPAYIGLASISEPNGLLPCIRAVCGRYIIDQGCSEKEVSLTSTGCALPRRLTSHSVHLLRVPTISSPTVACKPGGCDIRARSKPIIMSEFRSIWQPHFMRAVLWREMRARERAVRASDRAHQLTANAT